MAKVTRGRNWTFLGYPDDSLPENYKQILDDYRIPWAESPVHDADLDENGKPKKKHIHFILAFDGNKSYDQIKEMLQPLGGPVPQLCRNVKSMVRYFIHYDDPDKYQYAQADIKVHCGFDFEGYFGRNEDECIGIVADVLKVCAEQNIDEFADLVDYAFSVGDIDFLRLITGRYMNFFAQYLRSKSNKHKRGLTNRKNSV